MANPIGMKGVAHRADHQSASGTGLPALRHRFLYTFCCRGWKHKALWGLAVSVGEAKKEDVHVHHRAHDV
jgi:hypothetical protein